MSPANEKKEMALLPAKATSDLKETDKSQDLNIDDLFAMDPIIAVHRAIRILGQDTAQVVSLEDKLEILLILNEYLEDTKLAREFIRLARHGIVWSLLEAKIAEKINSKC
ncbi:hypothetical protein ACOME3_008231 [Neoechinorhynchus agilis]